MNPPAPSILSDQTFSSIATENQIIYNETIIENITANVITADIIETPTVTGLELPQASSDAANKEYVDQGIKNISWKTVVSAASVGTVTLAGTQTVDGVNLMIGNRVLVKDQTSGTVNGIYIVGEEEWERSGDALDGSVATGSAVYVSGGTQNFNVTWICDTTTGAPNYSTVSFGSTTPIEFIRNSAQAAGDTTWVQYNEGDIFAASSDFTFDHRAVSIGLTSNSTNATTGALIVSGGIGLSKNLNVGSNIYCPILSLKDPSSDFTVNFRASSLGASYTLIMPPDDGVAGQFLQTDGNGLTSWASTSASVIATNATNSSNSVLSNDVGNATDYITFSNGPTGAQPLKTTTGITLNPSNASISATTFIGAHTGVSTLATVASSAIVSSSSILLNDTANATDYLIFSNTASGASTLKTTTGVSLNPSTASITATTFIGNFTGVASTATMATSAIVSSSSILLNDTASATDYLIFSNNPTGANNLKTTTGLSLNPSLAALTATTFIGSLTGNASTATNATNSTNSSNAVLVNDVANAFDYLIFANSATGAQVLKTNTAITLNPSIGLITNVYIPLNIISIPYTCWSFFSISASSTNPTRSIGTNNLNGTTVTVIRNYGSVNLGYLTPGIWIFPSALYTDNKSGIMSFNFGGSINSASALYMDGYSSTVSSNFFNYIFNVTSSTSMATLNLNVTTKNASSTGNGIAFLGDTLNAFYSASSSNYIASYLVVGGGGGAGNNYSAGGGAGGVLAGSTLTLITGQTYTATVGAGGPGSTTSGTVSGFAGSNSSFVGYGVNVLALGGGPGMYFGTFAFGGAAGGSGGGGTAQQNGFGATLGSIQGNSGGNGGASNGGAGGGGGAGSAGSNGLGTSNGAGGNGGNGVSSSITGSAIIYGGGGGGGGFGAAGGTGGTGGGGNAGTNLVNGSNGTANLGGGGGGGGANSADGGGGGSGVVILSILSTVYSGTVTGTYSTSAAGSNTVIKWTAGSGTYVA